MIAWTFSGSGGPDSQNAVEEIYQQYKRLMFATAGSYVENVADQEDIVQTALVRLVRIFSAPDASERCISAGYIVATVRSVSVELLRKRGREAEHIVSLEDSQIEQAVAEAATMDDLMLLAERAEQLWAIWPKLPEEDRFLLEGKYILDYSDQQLAAALKCNPNSIRMKLTRARRRAFKLLSERT